MKTIKSFGLISCLIFSSCTTPPKEDIREVCFISKKFDACICALRAVNPQGVGRIEELRQEPLDYCSEDFACMSLDDLVEREAWLDEWRKFLNNRSK